jgi:hypothetical protein
MRTIKTAIGSRVTRKVELSPLGQRVFFTVFFYLQKWPKIWATIFIEKVMNIDFGKMGRNTNNSLRENCHATVKSEAIGNARRWRAS